MLFERIIAPVFPAWALSRAQARLAFEALRGYDAARHTRRTRGWQAGSGSANAETQTTLETLRNRSRDVVRNNPYAAGGLDALVSFQVGTGIVPRSATGNQALDKQWQAAFEAWAGNADVAGAMDFYALQAAAARARAQDGEALLRLVPLSRREASAAGLDVPLQLQLLEADYISSFRDQLGTQLAAIRQGVELDAWGKPVAYHLFTAHPGETWGPAGMDTVRVPAGELLHLYRADRPGQLRGVPDLTPAIPRLRSLDEYEDAALEQAKVQACVAAFVTSDAGAAKGPLEAKTSEGEARKSLAPGLIERLRIGEQVQFLTPSGAGDFSPLAKHHLRAVAVGFGLTYDLLTGDLESANYSSLRAGRIAFKQRLARTQWLLLIPRLVAPVCQAWTRAAQLAGVLPATRGPWPLKYGPPRFPLLDPQTEMAGILAELRTGAMTWPQMVTEAGYDPHSQLAEIAEWNISFDAAGIILDGDPRRIAKSGGAQNPAANAAVELAAKPGDAAAVQP